MTDVLDTADLDLRPIGADGRLDLVHAAIGLYRRRAFNEVTLELLAAEAGTTLQEVQAHFPTCGELMIAALQVWNTERMSPIDPLAEQYGAVAYLRGIVVANIADPALMRTLAAAVNLAATPDHPVAPTLQRMWLHFHAHVQRTLAHDIAVGREPATMEPARGAEQLIALYEGLQLQAMVRTHMNLLEAYDRAVTRMREGWSHAYSAPVWEI